MKQVTATVVQEGRFLKVYTNEGNDVSNQVERPLRKAALDAGAVLMFNANSGQWEMNGTQPAVEEAAPVLDAALMNDIEFIHQSYSMKPKELMISELKWKYLVRSAMRGKNIMMTGPAGTGKTMASKYLVQSLQRPDFYFNLGATQDPRATLIGNTHFNKEEGTYFSESLFVKAIQTENAVILLDELSRAHPEAWNILMTVLDLNQRYLRLDEKDGSPTIKVAPGVCFIATANIGNEYTSTRIMDRALMDRFIIVEMEQLDLNHEIHLLKLKAPKAKLSLIESLANIASDIRKELKSDSPKLTNTLTTRACVEIASLLEDGFSLAEASEVAIYPFFSNDGGIDSERTFVRQVVQKYCINEDAKTTLFDDSDVAF
jgi:MoxR-like ATPase